MIIGTLLYFLIGTIVNTIYMYQEGKYLTLGDVFVSIACSISWPVILVMMLGSDVIIFDRRDK